MSIARHVVRNTLVGSAALLLYAQIASGGASSRGQTHKQPIVKIQSGFIAGSYSEPGSRAATFRGIPYAAPPTHELRWKAPLPAQKWEGIRSATRFGSPCPQLPARYFKYLEG